jgi:hypothetical protein
MYGGPSRQFEHELAHLPRRRLLAIGAGMLVLLALLYVFGSQVFGG